MRANDAAEALCLVEQPHFAGQLGLVIAGLHLPGIGGPAFVAELHSRLPKVPVLVLGSASDNPTDYPEAPVRFLPRPTTAEELLDAAGQILQEHGR